MQLNQSSVLVMGGTKGIGRAIGLEFAKLGAKVFLTYKWGSADHSELLQAFKKMSDVEPVLIEADAGDKTALADLMKKIAKMTDRKLDIMIHCVAFAKLINDINDFKHNSLELSLKYSAWPLIEILQLSQQVLEKFPRYVVAISSDGVDVCHPGYDLVGCSKAVVETMTRYLAVRLKSEGVNINTIRAGLIKTDSLRMTFGDNFIHELEKKVPNAFMDPHEVAKTCVALCSGLMDAVTGQVITADHGWSLASPLNIMNELSA